MKFISGLAAVALATTALAQPASAATTPVSPTTIAGDWITSQLSNGVAVGEYGPDIGLTIDGGLALAAMGRTADAGLIADSIGAYLVTTQDVPYGYVRSDEYDFNPPYAYVGEGLYANATAKAAAFTERVGRDASTAYAAVDLIAQLEDLTDDSTGQIADVSSYGNYANTIGQAFAAEALAVTGSLEAPAAMDALLTQQCPSGYFRLSLGTTGCADAVDGPNPDVTALAVLALVESGITTTDVVAAINGATQWLESVQQPDGSVQGDAFTPDPNANSTGLAAWALGAAGRSVAAARSAAWARGVQASDAGTCAGKAETGAIAYVPGDLVEARADGLGLKRDSWRRATFQAAPALLWAPDSTAPLAITTPGVATQSSAVNAVVSGLDAGEYACVSFGATARSVKGTGAEVTVPFDLPAGSGTYTFSVTTLGGTESSTTTVPAPISTPTPTPTPTVAPTPTSAEPVVGELTASKVERVTTNVLKLTVTCDGTAPCAGKLKVRSARKVELANGQFRKLLMAKKEYSVAAGKTATVRLRLQRPARKVLGDQRLRVVATQTARGVEPVSDAFWLRRK